MSYRADKSTIRTVLSAETKLKGLLRFEDSLEIGGSFEGNIETPGFLLVDHGAKVTANVRAGSLVVGGVIHGDIETSEYLELLPGAEVIGNIRTPRLSMPEDAELRGACEMIEEPVGIDIFAAPSERLKKSLIRGVDSGGFQRSGKHGR